jgi:hypothetical protein
MGGNAEGMQVRKVIHKIPRQIRVAGFSGDRKRRPPDFTDSDVVDAILTEVEWEEEGLPDTRLDGWWSDAWSQPAGKPEDR